MTRITEIMNRMTITGLTLLLLMPGAVATEEGEGYSLDEPLAGVVALLALIPFTIAVLAYQRTRNTRMLLLSAAFGIFFVKGSMLFLEHDLEPVGLDLEGVHFMAVFLDFLILVFISWAMFRK